MSTGSQTFTAAEREALTAFVEQHGEAAAARLATVARGTLARALGGLPMLPSTALCIRRALSDQGAR